MPDRCALGATSLLTMSFLKIDCNTDMPKISYMTALDYYLITCYSFVLFSILEFALVHQEEFKMRIEQRLNDSKQKLKNKYLVYKNKSERRIERDKNLKKCFGSLLPQALQSTNYNEAESKTKRVDHGKFKSLYDSHSFRQRISRIDQLSKFFFPMLFITFNLTYFLYFYIKRNID